MTVRLLSNLQDFFGGFILKVASAEQIRKLEQDAINAGNATSLMLMEKAAKAVCNAALAARKKRAAVLCGAGKNGGDGFAVARLLKEGGMDVCVYALGDPEKRAEETIYQESIWKGEVRRQPDADIAFAEVIIDALFGIGFHGKLEGDFERAVKFANSRRGPGAPLRIAVDIPSGVNADTGAVEGEAFRAALTVTFTLPKSGQFLLPGAEYCGRVIPADVGIPPRLLMQLPCPFGTVDRLFADRVMPLRPVTAHKGDFGRVLVIGGSVDYPGAPAFAANAAVRTGAGLVTAAVPLALYPIMAQKLAEAMPRRMPMDKAGRFAKESLPALLTLQSTAQATVLGPGLGRSDTLNELVRALLLGGQSPVIVDADGIFALAQHKDVLQVLRRPVILTPHDGEFARLLGENPPAAGLERLECAREFAKVNRCILVLKGYRTITAAPDGRVFVNTTGNPGMAKGGSGDVLAGMIGALCAQRIDPFLAAALGVYFHGLAGDICANGVGEYGMTPSDMIGAIPAALKRYNSRTW